jgi:hypothetical protein
MRIWIGSVLTAQILHNAEYSLGLVVKALLRIGDGHTTEPAKAIQDRQVCNRNPGLPGRSNNPPGHFRDFVIRGAIGPVMKIMKFPDSGVPLLHHLDIELRCDGFDMVWRQS